MGTARRTALALLLIILAGSWGLFPPSSLSPTIHVTGTVHDEHGPLAGARVRVQGTPLVTSSDVEGRFALPAPAGERVVTAWKDGYLIGGARTGRGPLSLLLKRLPAEDHEAYPWVDPAPGPARDQNCANCHAEIYREWSASGHARSVENRRFLNLYDGGDWHGRPDIGWGLLTQYPDGAGVCTACHAPTVAFSDAAYFDLRQVRGTAARGVHCDFCHKVADVAGDNVGLTHGRFGLKLLRPAAGQLFFGPLDDVNRGEDGFAPVYRDSRYCASCHEGTVFGVHAYGTYSEWLESPARREGKQCQTCHMAPTGTMANIAPGKGGIPRDPRTLASHHFPGGQADMLRRCLHVSVRLTPRGQGGRAVVTVRADGVGHRVPTGFPDRNLVLVVEPLPGSDVLGTLRDGPVLPAAAGQELAGQPGRLYAKQLRGEDGHFPAPFWKARPELTDSRLVPGRADRAEFSFDRLPGQVRVRLLYHRFWPEVTESKGWPADEVVIVDRTLAFSPARETRWESSECSGRLEALVHRSGRDNAK